ncbi:MAG: hypothetical protein RR734_01480 [Bacilli bacterium]
MNVEIFDLLAKKFAENGFDLYMIGGTSRDFLVGRKLTDYDFATNAKTFEIRKFLPDASYTFEKYGIVQYTLNGHKCDIATFRTEERYEDLRHPSLIKFVNSINEDYKRRDFTINAIYIDKNYETIDPSNGIHDLKEEIVRMIGDPEERIKEDPLRIIRAYRFSLILDFKLEGKLKKVMIDNVHLLSKIKREKIIEEFRKIEKANF